MCNMCRLPNDLDFPLLIAPENLTRWNGNGPSPYPLPALLERSAAVSSSTSRSTRQAPDAFELPTRCGWSSTQLRSVPMGRGEGSGAMLLPHVARIPAPGQEFCAHCSLLIG